jgi:hypothetical protein
MLTAMVARLTVVIVALAAAGCSGSRTEGISPHLGSQLRAARRFTAFPLYWAGRRVAGLPLAVVSQAADHDGVDVTFTYGTCQESGGAETCAPPLEVQVTNLCNRLPRDVGSGSPARRLRGALAGPAERGTDNGADVTIYVKGLAVTLFGRSRLVRAAVQALRPFPGLAAPRAGSALPAASRAAVAGHGC